MNLRRWVMESVAVDEMNLIVSLTKRNNQVAHEKRPAVPGVLD